MVNIVVALPMLKTSPLLQVPRPKAKTLNKTSLAAVVSVFAILAVMALSSLFQTTPTNDGKRLTALPAVYAITPLPTAIMQLPDYQDMNMINMMLNRNHQPIIVPPAWAIWLQKQLDVLAAQQALLKSKLR